MSCTLRAQQYSSSNTAVTASTLPANHNKDLDFDLNESSRGFGRDFSHLEGPQIRDLELR